MFDEVLLVRAQAAAESADVSNLILNGELVGGAQRVTKKLRNFSIFSKFRKKFNFFDFLLKNSI